MGMNALEVRRRVMMAQPHEAVASGAVASFRTDVLSPLKMQFDLLPIQDLHGQANPYPSGGSPQIWDEEWEVGNVSTVDGQNSTGTTGIRSKNYIAVSPSTAYYFVNNGTDVYATVCFYDANKDFISGVSGASGGIHKNSTITTLNNAYFMRFSLPGYGTTYNNNISINYPSTDHNYHPYSNICPITGHDGFTRIRTGKNLFGGDLMRDGVLASMPTASDDAENRCVAFSAGAGTVQAITNESGLSYRFKENTKYTFVLTLRKSTGNGGNLRIYYTDGTYMAISGYSTTKTTLVFVTSATKTVRSLNKTNSSGVTYLYYDECGIFEGELTASEFEAYKGTSEETTFPTPPGTVYGGHITDNGDGTYDLTVDRVNAVFDGSDDERWLSTTDNLIQLYALKLGNNGFVVNDECISNELKNESAISVSNGIVGFRVFNSGGYNDARIAVRPPWAEVGSTVQQLKTWLASNPLQVVYKLSNPTVYTGLTLTALQSLIGQNHIWVDNADEVSVEYWGH